MRFKVDLAEGKNLGGPLVIQVHGFLQNAFPAGIAPLVDSAVRRIDPCAVVTIVPNYRVLASSGETLWVDYAEVICEALWPLVESRCPLILIGDSWVTPLMQIGRNLAIDHRMIAFRVPRIGHEREVLVGKYEAMARGCVTPEKLANYRSGFPLLPDDPFLAASIFRGAAKSGLELQTFSQGSRIAAVEGFHDELFHPASALDVVRQSGGSVVATVEQALVALRLT